MPHFHIFTDGSVNTQLNIGYGAYLSTSDLSLPLSALTGSIKVKRFDETSSTKLELQTFLWALDEVRTLNEATKQHFTVYTDCQNIIGLPKRQARLEKNHYISSNKKQLKHAELYRAFYHISSELTFTLVKVAGHKAASDKNSIERLFSLVDKASRHALRENIQV